jgi:HK97 family phage prohead protease
MPWHVSKSDSCPESRPWAVIKDADGSVEGCHASEADAKKQLAALYAQESLTPAGAKMEHKSFQLLEAKADVESGTFEALVSVFHNVDTVGDRIQPGAFKKSLERWNQAGDPIPVILSHDWQNPWSHIGVVHPGDAKETDRGLFVKGHLDVRDNEVAKQVHRLMQRRSLKEFSFGYKVVKEKRAKDGANDLLDVDLIEVGPTLKGANPATELHAVKSAVEDDAPPPPPDEKAIRRELERHKLSEASKGVEEVEPGPDPVEVLAGQVEALKAELEETKAKVLPPEPPRSENQIRDEFERGRAKEAIRGVEKAKPGPTPIETLSNDVAELKRQLGEIAAGLDDKLKALEKAVEEPRGANSVEDRRFRQEAKRAVVEFDLDGVESLKPPEPGPEPEREPEWALKARMRRDIYNVLKES